MLFLPSRVAFIIMVDHFTFNWLAYKSSIAGEESNFGAAAGEAVPTMTYVLYFVEIPILIYILYYIIQLPGCQDKFITVNYSQVISLRGKLDTSLGGSDYIYYFIFYFINNIKYKNILWLKSICALIYT